MSTEREGVWTRLVFGLTILAVGLIFWLDRIHRLNAWDWLQWWPLATVALGLANLAARKWAAAAILVGVGVVFSLPLLGYDFHAWRLIGLWPLMISAAGATIIAHAMRRHSGGFEFHAVAFMAGDVRHLGSQKFGHGEAIAVMGGCEIDLTAARLAPGASIDVLALWGGIEIRVPSGWAVESKVVPILGGFENTTARAPEGAPTLKLRGSVIMGGVEVRNG